MYRLERILVPTDFSVHAEAALQHAIYMGGRYRAHITVLHVDEFSVSPLGARGPESPEVAAYQREKARFLQEQFEELRRKYQSTGVQLDTRVIPGRSYKVIVELAEKEAFDMVVIATRGLTDLSTHLIGSTAERVVRLSRQPVLTIQGEPREKVRSILCPTDVSPAGNVALTYAIGIALLNDAPLYIQYISELDRPESEADIMRRMPSLAELNPAADKVKVEDVFDRDVEPSNSIIRFAEDRGVDLIVMSAHGRKGLRRVYIGNTTAEVVRQSTRPVLTVTHPIHKKIFVRPATEAVPIEIKREQDSVGPPSTKRA